jgi:hypothetical protein
MDSSSSSPKPTELPPKARRAVRIIYIAMALMILVPFVLIWWTGAFRF